jgi:type IV secretory pathway TrbF-like protein
VAVFVKLGPLLLGTARIEVEPTGSTSRVTWSETVYLRGLPAGATRWLGTALVDVMVRLVLTRATREARLAAQRSAG